MFNLAIDSKLRGCDLVRLKVDDVCFGGKVRERATVVQKKTGRPVQFELTEQTRSSIQEWLTVPRIGEDSFLLQKRSLLKGPRAAKSRLETARSKPECLLQRTPTAGAKRWVEMRQWRPSGRPTFSMPIFGMHLVILT